MISTIFRKGFLFLGIFFPLLSFGDAPVWVTHQDATVTNVKFVMTQNGKPVSGEFTSFQADLKFDPEQLDTSSAHVEVDLSSAAIDGNPSLNDLLKSDPWFNVNKYPKAVFDAKKFSILHDNNYKAEGQLTIKGVTKPMTIIFNSPEFSAFRFRAKGTVVIKPSDFGIGQALLSQAKIDDNVEINFSIYSSSK